PQLLTYPLFRCKHSAPTSIYTRSLHDALPICLLPPARCLRAYGEVEAAREVQHRSDDRLRDRLRVNARRVGDQDVARDELGMQHGAHAGGCGMDPAKIARERAALEKAVEQCAGEAIADPDLGAGDGGQRLLRDAAAV